MKRRTPPTEGDGLVYGHHAPKPRLTLTGAALLAAVIAVPAGTGIGLLASLASWLAG